jgi:hypothetical protein
MKLAVSLALTFCASAAFADPAPTVNPYRVWWSFVSDDKAAVEVDDPDLAESTVGEEARWPTRWAFAREMQSCDAKASRKLRDKRDLKSTRELRIETLDGQGQVRATSRCVMTLLQWRKRLGSRLYERLERELDAHEAFLHPRRYPGMPEDPNNPPQQFNEDDRKP